MNFITFYIRLVRKHLVGSGKKKIEENLQVVLDSLLHSQKYNVCYDFRANGTIDSLFS